MKIKIKIIHFIIMILNIPINTRANISMSVKEEYLNLFMKHKGANSCEENEGRCDFTIFKSQMGSYDLRLMMAEQFSTSKDLSRLSLTGVSINDGIESQLEIFRRHNQHIIQKLFPTKTVFGEVYGSILLLNHLTSDKKQLAKRQKVISGLADRPDLLEDVQTILGSISRSERDIMDFFHKKHYLNVGLQEEYPTDEVLNVEKTRQLMPNDIPDDVLLQLAKSNNLNFSNLLTSELIKHKFIPAMTTVYLAKNLLAFIPNSIRTRKSMKSKIDFRPTLTFENLRRVYFGISSCFYMADFFRDNDRNLTLVKEFRQKMRVMAEFINAILNVQLLGENLPQELQVKLTLKELKFYKLFVDIIDGLGSEDMVTFYNIEFYKSSLLVLYRHFMDLRKLLINRLLDIAMLDFYSSVAQKMAEASQNLGEVKLSYAQFIESAQQPVIDTQKIWHPLIDRSEAVTNNLSLGGEEKRGLVITGPNGSGKSTLMRSVGLNVWLAQTLGIVAAGEFKLTPFTHIHVFMSQKDSAGELSSFQQEVDNAQRVLSIYKNLRPTDKVLLIMDEPFSSTNPTEGAILSRALLGQFSKNHQLIFLTSTHYKELADITEEHLSGSARNVYMETNLADDGLDFSNTYLMKNGTNTQTNALRILENALNHLQLPLPPDTCY